MTGLSTTARVCSEKIENTWSRSRPRASVLGPAGQGFGDRIHERHVALRIGRDHGVADAAQRGHQPATRLVLAFQALGAQQRLRAMSRQRLDEASLLGREPSRLVETDAKKAQGPAFGDQRHAPEGSGATLMRRRARQIGIEHGVVGVALGPGGQALLHPFEDVGVALRVGDALDPRQDLGRHAAIGDQLQRGSRRIQQVQRAGVGGGRSYAVVDDHPHHIGARAFLGQGLRQLRQCLQSLSRLVGQPADVTLVRPIAPPGQGDDAERKEREDDRSEQGSASGRRSDRLLLDQKTAHAVSNAPDVSTKRVHQPLAMSGRQNRERFAATPGANQSHHLGQVTHGRLRVGVGELAEPNDARDRRRSGS